MEKRSKVKMGCGVMILILCAFTIFFVRLNKDFSKLEEVGKAIKYSTSIEFKPVKQTIFITARKWGLGGQHSHVIISDIDHVNDDIIIDRDKEIVFDNTCGLYYRQQDPDSLFIFLSSNSYIDEKNVHKQIGIIKIEITELKIINYRDLEANYKELGLSFIHCFDEKNK